jgi:di/tricarboxylate transporter
VPWKAALYTLTMAASASFSTPVSYQTNLMVSRQAGYAFSDFLRFGVPLQLVCAAATVPACYLIYK